MACQAIANYAGTVFPRGYSWPKVGQVDGFLAQYVFSQSGWQADKPASALRLVEKVELAAMRNSFATQRLRVADWQ